MNITVYSRCGFQRLDIGILTKNIQLHIKSVTAALKTK